MSAVKNRIVVFSSNIGSPTYLPGFFLRFRCLVFFFAPCCGGLFATTSMARSKRDHASGNRNSTLLSGFFVMTDGTYTTPVEDEFLFSSIGRLKMHLLGWCHEFALDAIILIIHHRVGGKSIEQEMPWSLSRKVKYIRKCFSKLDPLKPKCSDVLGMNVRNIQCIRNAPKHHSWGGNTPSRKAQPELKWPD